MATHINSYFAEKQLMPQTFFYNQDGTVQDWNGWDFFRAGIARLIFGKPGGKFGSHYNTPYPKSKQPILLDCSENQLMLVAMNVPHLNTVISRGAQLFSMMAIRHVDKDGEPIENSEVLKFLKQPNPIQNQEQYLYQYYVMNGVYNKTIQYKIKGLSFEQLPKTLWLLPTGEVKINVTGKIYRQTELKEIIENFEMTNAGGIFEADRCIYMSEGIGTDPINPKSRIEALQIPLSNIVASMKSRNIIVTERGMIGFLTPEQTKDADGALPFSDEEHKRVREEYQNSYNLNSSTGHVGFPKVPMKWVPMTFNTQELGLSEGTEEDFARLVDAFAHDRDLYSSVKGATFENKAAGVRSTIQLGIQPVADYLMRAWTKEFLPPDSGERLEACYEHLPAMKKDERLAAQADLYKAQTLEIGLHSGVISQQQFADEMEWDKDGDGKIIQRSNNNQNGNQPAGTE